ncbi:MAG: DUF2971 domain-containing protein [Thermoanaerobaculia bacterium]
MAGDDAIDWDNYELSSSDPAIESEIDQLGKTFYQWWLPWSAGQPNSLWHYTDAEGFRAIITNGTLRLSHSRLLNDSTESALGWSRVTSELDTEIASQVHLSEFFKMTKAVANDVHNAYHYFIFSLSERDDSLSQWRAYGSGGTGYSLCFDGRALAEERRDGDFMVVRLVYDEKRHRRLIREAIDHTRAVFQKIIARNPDKKDQPGIAHRVNVHLAQHLMRVSLLAKDASFEDEKECRLIVGYSPKSGQKDVDMLKNVGFRSAGGIARPYFDFDFRTQGEEPDKTLPLVAVRYGPSLQPVTTEFSARFLLDQKGYREINVLKSSVPLQA